VSLCKKLLVANWCSSADMAQTRESHNIHQKNFECSFCDGNYHEYELVHLGEGNTWIFNDEDSYVKKCKINFKKEFALVMQRAKAKFQPEMQYINVSSYLFSPGCIIYLEALCPFFAFSYFVFTSFINKHFY
jgi:galactose-1-phosphate uridylyltransferase